MQSSRVSIVLFGLVFLAIDASAQLVFPNFLEGTWKIENQEAYERWDRLDDRHFKGIAYLQKEGEVYLTEYLDLKDDEGVIVYEASVPGHNEGRGIPFIMEMNDQTVLFKNPAHDFPKQIAYTPLNELEIMVTLSDGIDRTYSYKLIKVLKKESNKDSSVDNPNYNEELARQLDADEYGMKKYVLVILKTGSNETKDKELTNRCFRGHLENITRLAEEKKLIVAGPIGKNDNSLRGIFIFNTSSQEEVLKMLENDPAITEKLLAVELYPWYGSAALPEYLDSSDKIWKVKP